MSYILVYTVYIYMYPMCGNLCDTVYDKECSTGDVFLINFGNTSCDEDIMFGHTHALRQCEV